MEIDEIVVDENEQDEIIVDEDDNTEIDIEGSDTIYKATDNYEEMKNLPSINDVTLKGNKTSKELNLQEKGDYIEELTTMDEMQEMIEKYLL